MDDSNDSVPFSCVRGVNSAKVPDSPAGGVPVVNCLDVDSMEEEVQVKVQVEVEREEQGEGETHGTGTRRGFLFGETVRVIFLCQLVHLCALLLGPANFEFRFTIDLVSLKTILNSFVMSFLAVNSFATSLPRVEGDEVL